MKKSKHQVMVKRKLSNKRCNCFKQPKRDRIIKKKLYHALLTIRPTSVEPKRAFSAIGLFATKTRNRLNDDTLNAMVVVRQFHKK